MSRTTRPASEFVGHHPFQWAGRTRGGVEVFKKNAGQSYARQHDLKMILVYALDDPIPFGIEIPLGAEPVIFRRGVVSPGSHTFTYFYGWRTPGDVRLWEFGGPTVERWRGPSVERIERA